MIPQGAVSSQCWAANFGTGCGKFNREWTRRDANRSKKPEGSMRKADGGGVDASATAIQATAMSAQEIIAELPKLGPDDFRLVKAKVDDLARAHRRTIGDALLELAGTAEGLPHDMARNHDHYLHGTPRRDS